MISDIPRLKDPRLEKGSGGSGAAVSGGEAPDETNHQAREGEQEEARGEG